MPEQIVRRVTPQLRRLTVLIKATLELNTPTETWAVLRGLRASPPGLAAGDDARRSVFAAALEQAEQFLSAASAVGFATKPVQLFYALSQSGRAIAAARADEPWRINGHGAQATFSELGIGRTAVKPDLRPAGALGVVARAIKSEMWTDSVPLGALWASLPELPYDDSLCVPEPGVLEVLPDGGSSPYLFNYGVQAMGVWPPGNWSWSGAVKLASPAPENRDELHASLEELLKPYPRAAGWSLAADASIGITVSNSTTAVRGDPCLVWLRWTHDDGTRMVVELVAESYDDRLFSRPGISAEAALPSPLVTWWGVLLALSMHARYDPVGWRRALDIDGSPIGWTLERALTLAQTRIPQLVLDALAVQ